MFALEGQEKIKLVGLDVQHTESLAGGEQLIFSNEEVGQVKSPVWSHRLNKSLALAHIRPDLSKTGTKIEVINGNDSYQSTCCTNTFLRPTKITHT